MVSLTGDNYRKLTILSFPVHTVPTLPSPAVRTSSQCWVWQICITNEYRKPNSSRKCVFCNADSKWLKPYFFQSIHAH